MIPWYTQYTINFCKKSWYRCWKWTDQSFNYQINRVCNRLATYNDTQCFHNEFFANLSPNSCTVIQKWIYFTACSGLQKFFFTFDRSTWNLIKRFRQELRHLFDEYDRLLNFDQKRYCTRNSCYYVSIHLIWWCMN